jgi:hypothetical protein
VATEEWNGQKGLTNCLAGWPKLVLFLIDLVDLGWDMDEKEDAITLNFPSLFQRASLTLPPLPPFSRHIQPALNMAFLFHFL